MKGLTNYLHEGVIGLIGAVVGASVAYISLMGYRKTGSPALIRLSLAFFLIAMGLGLEVFNGRFLPIEDFATALLIATTLQAAGYFFIAFSHILKVTAANTVRAVSPLLVPVAFTTGIIQTLRSVSFYFMLYAAAETIISYWKTRTKDTLMVGFGFGILAFSELVRWLGLFYPPDNLYSLSSSGLKILGFATLFIPVAKFALMKREV